jgi:hypothetical protein
MQPNTYLKDLVARCLAERGLPGSVEIYPRVPLARRLETGERIQFVVEYHGHGDARFFVDEYEIACGTVGAPVARSLGDRIAKERRVELAA